MYAPTAEIGGFVVDESVKEECARYVSVPRVRWGSRNGVKLGSESERSRGDERSSVSSAASQHSDTYASTSGSGYPAQTSGEDDDSRDSFDIPHETLITLYTSLRQGLTLRNFVLENLSLLGGIDVRRFITFGIIKGFLYRVHKYAIATSISLPPAPPTSLQSGPASTATSTHAHKDSDASTIRGHAHHLHHKPSLASTANVFTSGPNAGGERRIDDVTRLDSLVSQDREEGLPLVRFLDGIHCFDEICTELEMSEKSVEGKVKGVGEVQIFSR